MSGPLLNALPGLVTVGILLLGGSAPLGQVAQAQGSDRGERAESREESSRNDRDVRREAWRSRVAGESFRGRDFRRDRDRDDAERDGEDRSSRSESLPSAVGPSASSRGASSASGDARRMTINDYARGLVKQHDKDGDNMLKGDERRELRGRVASADLNNDGVITIDELVSHLSSSTTAATSGGSSSGGESSDRRESDRDADRDRDRERFFSFRRGDRDRDSNDRRRADAAPAVKRVYLGSVSGNRSEEPEKNQRRTYRFTPPTERLPKDLPSWFKSRDANVDGQVSMSEYSRTWSKRTLDDFRRYDLNNDGVITPKEAAAK